VTDRTEQELAEYAARTDTEDLYFTCAELARLQTSGTIHNDYGELLELKVEKIDLGIRIYLNQGLTNIPNSEWCAQVARWDLDGFKLDNHRIKLV
jgi:hypothetical protein